MNVSKLSNDELELYYIRTYFKAVELFGVSTFYWHFRLFFGSFAFWRGCALLNDVFLDIIKIFVIKFDLHVCTFSLNNQSVNCFLIFEHVAKLKRFFGAHILTHFC